MTDDRADDGAGRSPFRAAHAGHVFEGFEIVVRGDIEMLVARCDCGASLGEADAAYRDCPGCGGAACSRCGGEGRVIDHSRLVWRLPAD